MEQQPQHHLQSLSFLISLLEYNFFPMLCQFLLYNKVNQLYVYIYPHIPSLLCLPPTLPIPPIQVVTKHQADLLVLCGCFPLAICFTFGNVYMSMLLFHFVQAYPSPMLLFQYLLVCAEDLNVHEDKTETSSGHISLFLS